MSFVNLMEDHDWSDEDIVNRCENWIWGQFPRVQYDILLNKLEGTRMPAPFTYTMTPEEQGRLMEYAQLRYVAGTMADAARADMALLRAAWAVEQGNVDGASPEALQLAADRAAARTVTVEEVPEQ